jgi:hypothetical protein
VTHFSFGANAGPSFTPVQTDYTTLGTYTVSTPVGATACVIEMYSQGGSTTDAGGASGGTYAKKTLSSLSGITALYLNVGPFGGLGGSDCFVKTNNSSGTDICHAPIGTSNGSFSGANAPASGGIGDVVFYGGAGGNGFTGVGMGGGCGGPSGSGSAGGNSGGSGGAGGGGLAGAGGTNANGNAYGGGGSGSGGGLSPRTGGGPLIRLSWT